MKNVKAKFILLGSLLTAVLVFTTGQVANINPARTLIVPSSQLPIYTTIQPWDRFIGIDTNNIPFTNFSSRFDVFATNMANALSTNSVFLGLLSSNISVILVQGTNANLNQLATTINPIISTGYILAPSGISNFTLDFGHTNNFGQTNIYATIDATNNVNISGFTHFNMWGILSVNIFADGGNRTVWFPGNWWNPPNADLATNNLVISGSQYYIVLNNGNELRLTLQSNAPPPAVTSNHLSVIWTTFGQ